MAFYNWKILIILHCIKEVNVTNWLKWQVMAKHTYKLFRKADNFCQGIEQVTAKRTYKLLRKADNLIFCQGIEQKKFGRLFPSLLLKPYNARTSRTQKDQRIPVWFPSLFSVKIFMPICKCIFMSPGQNWPRPGCHNFLRKTLNNFFSWVTLMGIWPNSTGMIPGPLPKLLKLFWLVARNNVQIMPLSGGISDLYREI